MEESLKMMGQGKMTTGQRKKERRRRQKREKEEEEKKNRKKQLYVFFWHCCGTNGGSNHSLYALDIPEEDPDPSIATPKSSPEERLPLEPCHLFREGDYPQIMACAQVSSKLYFFGGHYVYNDHLKYPRTVFTMDLSTSATRAQGVHKKEAAKMHTGKCNPVSFVDDDKIFVVSAYRRCRFTKARLWNFEVFDTKKNKWTKYPEPCFGGDERYVSNCVVAGDKVIFCCPDGKYPALFYYDLTHSRGYHSDYEGLKDDPKPDANWNHGWHELDTRAWPGSGVGPLISFSSPLVGDTLYITKNSRGVFAIPEVSNSSMFDYNQMTELEDVIKSSIDSPLLTCILTHIGKGRFCFIQAGPPTITFPDSKWPLADDGEPYIDEDAVPFENYCHISITLFHAQSGENNAGHSSKHLNSVHYVTASISSQFTPRAAHLV